MATQFSGITGRKPRKSAILDIIRAEAPFVAQDKVLKEQIGIQRESQELEEQRFVEDLAFQKRQEEFAVEVQKANEAALARGEASQSRRDELVRMQGEQAQKQARITTGIQAAGTALDVVRTVKQLGGPTQVVKDIGGGISKIISSIGSFFKSFF